MVAMVTRHQSTSFREYSEEWFECSWNLRSTPTSEIYVDTKRPRVESNSVWRMLELVWMWFPSMASALKAPDARLDRFKGNPLILVVAIDNDKTNHPIHPSTFTCTRVFPHLLRSVSHHTNYVAKRMSATIHALEPTPCFRIRSFLFVVIVSCRDRPRVTCTRPRVKPNRPCHPNRVVEVYNRVKRRCRRWRRR